MIGICTFFRMLLALQSTTTTSLSSSPLGLEEVIKSVRSSHPDLEAAEEQLNAADAKRFAARGAWDPKLDLKSNWTPIGYYENGHLNASIRQNTPLWGIGLYAGYRIGWGNHPIYKGNLETLPGGELRAGVDIPLAQNGPIDPQRAEIKRSTRLRNASECTRRKTELQLGQKAARTYWKWVAAGQELRVQQELLGVARKRVTGLQEQADLGSIPQIDIIDNQRLVLERQSKLIEAQQKFQAATLDLSLFFRDSQQKPIRVQENRLPPLNRNANHYLSVLKLPSVEADIEEALRRRPETCELQENRAAAKVELRLARNQRSPKINVQGFAARDIGTGAKELEATELGVGLSIELPMLQTKARGNYRSAQAKLRQWDAKFRGQRDRIIAELHQAHVDLNAAYQQIVVAQQQVEAANELAEAERQKLVQGASNLVLVNLREIAAAGAARQEIEAITGFQYAFVDYLSVSGRGL